MRTQLKRLITAALLSSSGFAITFYFYEKTEPKRSLENNEPPIASVANVQNEIQRKPAKNFMWEQVFSGESLYPGEAIRTSDNGEVRIQFEDGKFIDLEPESLVVLKKSEGEIALDLMEGSVFVNAKAQNDTGTSNQLVLNSSNGRVDLSGATASLSKGTGSRLDVQVLEGSAQIKSKDGKTNIIESGKSGALGQNGVDFNRNDLQILSPVPQKSVFIDPDGAGIVPFKWKGFPSKWKVGLYTGSSRKDLKLVMTTSEAGLAELGAKLPMGKFFWKLVAIDPLTNKSVVESSVYRNELFARYAPTMIFPTADAKIPVEKAPYAMTFKWQKGDDTSKVQLEIAKDPELKQKISTQTFSGQETFVLPNLTFGEYFWRISAYYDGTDKPLVGKVQKFSVQSLASLKPKDPVNIVWTVPNDKSTQYFLDTPELNLSWTAKNRQDEIKNWKVIYSQIDSETKDASTSDQLAKDQQTLEVKDTNTKALLSKPGRYIASIVALDKDGEIIGESEKRNFETLPMPRLPSPRLLPLEGVLKSGEDGKTELKWENLVGAKEYKLTVTREGKELANKTYPKSSTNLKNLMPGEYELKVLAVDQYGRESEAPVVRKLIVPDKSNLKAPTLKKIKVN